MMSLHATARIRDGIATITLVGQLDPQSVPRLAELVDSASAVGVRHLVLNLRRLTHLSSAAVRYLANTHQRLGREVRIEFTEACEEVSETIRLAGLHRSVTMTGR